MPESSDKPSSLDQALAQLEEANERVNKRAGRDLAAAIGVGLSLGAGVILSLCIFDKFWFIFFGGYFLLGAAVVELALAFRHRDFVVPVIPVALTALVTIPITFFFGPLWGLVCVLGGFVLTSAIQAIGGHSSSIGASAFTLFYVLGLGLFTIALVAMPDGQWWALSMLILAVSADVGAFASGVMFGKHPMAPRISPKKTWEGLAGAVVAVGIAGVFVALYAIAQPIWLGVLLGVLVLMSATAGDLFESQLKRWIGIKDMSNWLAGHGGFLDRLDSILPSGVVVFVVYLLVA